MGIVQRPFVSARWILQANTPAATIDMITHPFARILNLAGLGRLGFARRVHTCHRTPDLQSVSLAQDVGHNVRFGALLEYSVICEAAVGIFLKPQKHSKPPGCLKDLDRGRPSPTPRVPHSSSAPTQPPQSMRRSLCRPAHLGYCHRSPPRHGKKSFSQPAALP